MMEAKRVALVTGASVGIGEATVRALHADGLAVIAAARRGDRLEALRDELGDAVLPFTLDVSDRAATGALPAGLPEGWRDVDVLINNAGLALGKSPAQETDLDDWERMVAVNVTGVLRLVHAFLPGMVARGRGRVVNVGSVAARYAYPGGNVYAASKAFVEHLTLNLKADLIGTGVHATTIAPGLVGGTEFSTVRFGGDEGRAAAVYEGIEYLTPSDVAEAIRWVVARPAHVNVNHLELMPDRQAPGPLVFARE